MKTGEAFICDAVRTPVGRYGGALAMIRPDDLAAKVIKAIADRNPSLDLSAVDDVILGSANQAGEDNRNISRMSLLLAGLPVEVTGLTVNRLCGSGMEAVAIAARAVETGDYSVVIAGGVESMSRAPYVMEKPSEQFSRTPKMYDTTLGWRFINPEFEKLYGTDSMMETAENLAKEYNISRMEQDLFALWSQEKASQAIEKGDFSKEIIPVSFSNHRGETVVTEYDEHPRKTTIEKLAGLKPLTGKTGTITAGNSSGINDGASALLIASGEAVKKYSLKPLARVAGCSVAGVPPRIMGIGPVPATSKLLKKLSWNIADADIIELNEAFAVQAIACLKGLAIETNDKRVNRLGGAIALGHPLGMSGARLITTATWQLKNSGLKKALCTMCIGVGQGIAMGIESV
jgi:3-oxoadipyl-CoA thiolase